MGLHMVDRVELASRLDTGAAAALATALSQRPSDGHVVLDGRNVSHLGAQALQVILSAGRTFRSAGGALECADFSDRAEAHVRAMGLTVADLTEVADDA